MGASSEEGTETLVAHWKVMENLEHVEQKSNRHREQNHRLERTHHLEQRD